MITLGVDPGTRLCGWGVVERRRGKLVHIAHGVIRAKDKWSLPERLIHIERELCRVLERHRPEAGSVETLFFHKDAQAAVKLGHARGVVLLSLARMGTRVFEYAPAKVKYTVAGRGQADKRQVALIVRAVLGLGEVPPSDAADALALAVTHLRLASATAGGVRNASERPARSRQDSALRALVAAKGRFNGALLRG